MNRIRVWLLCAATVPVMLWANRDGAQPRKTGGPFPGESVCTECHSGSFLLNGGPGSITFSVQPYQPGQTQRVTITVADPSTTARRWGFQLSARPANALTTQAGSFRAVNTNAQVICDNDRPAPCATPATLQFATHTLAGTRRNTAGPVTFEVEWTAPATPVGDIIFAAAGNAANNNDSEGGDNIYTRRVTVSPGTSAPPPPRITSVLGAGLSVPAVQQIISPNGLISIFGENFAPAGLVRVVDVPDLVDGKLPTKLADVCVQIGDRPARMFHVIGPGQLNVQVPTLPGGGSVSVVTTVNCGTPNEVRSNIQTVTLQAATPQFFLLRLSADGRNPIAARNALTGAVVVAADLFPGAGFLPARPGDFVALFATGFGITNPPVQDGERPAGIASTVNPVTVTLAGADVQVLYGGVAPFFAGLYQINIQIPESTADGDHPVVARIGGVATPAGAFITVKR